MYTYPHFTEKDAEAQRKAMAGGWGVVGGAGVRPRSTWLCSEIFPPCPAPGTCGRRQAPSPAPGSELLEDGNLVPFESVPPAAPSAAPATVQTQPSGVKRGDKPLVFFFLSC